MRLPPALGFAISLLAPPRCAICRSACPAGRIACARCERALDSQRSAQIGIAGLEAVITAAPYHGIARDLVAALKFGPRPALARTAARLIAASVPSELVADAIVPVPAAPARMLRRGFDPAEAIADALAARLELPLAACLARANGPRQVGRSRGARLGDPPRVRGVGCVPARALLVDDVLTTGATLAACARALRDGGCEAVVGVAFARSVGTGARWAAPGTRRPIETKSLGAERPGP
jgi:ComF family protein